MVDPFLYGALLAGAVVGRWSPWHPGWWGRVALGSVVLLVGLLGAELAAASPEALLSAVPIGLAVAVLLVAVTAGVARLLVGREGSAAPRAPPSRDALRLPIVILLALGAGYVVGRGSGLAPGVAVEAVLDVMIFLVAYDLPWSGLALRRLTVPLAASAAGALAVAAIVAIAGVLPPRAALATTLGFGWYTLTGPLVAAQLGAAAGFAAFLANFLRENLTMLASPYLGPRIGGAGLAAVGGATSMDTTLYFVARFGGRDSASLALATGVILTVAASLLVPLALALP